MLDGKVIAITRDRESAKQFIDMVESNKGKAIALPTISLVPRSKDAMLKFLDMLKAEYDYVLFMSANAVHMIFDALGDDQKRELIWALNNTTVVAVGPNTKKALEDFNVNVSLMPAKYSSYGIMELFSKKATKDKKIIIPRSSASTNYLAKSLSSMGMKVEELHVYDVKPAEHDQWEEFIERLRMHSIDCMIFTSASSVNSFFGVAMNYEDIEGLRGILKTINVIAIGPFTNDTLSEHGISAVVADEHTIAGTFDVAVKLLTK